MKLRITVELNTKDLSLVWVLNMHKTTIQVQVGGEIGVITK